jgi:hypothetical protein
MLALMSDSLAVAGIVARRIALPHGARLEIRPLVASDVDGLEAFYGRLSADDLYRRFFMASPPSRRSLEDWAKLIDRGGFGFVAVSDDGRIVADAGYVPVPDGGGEIGMTVDPAWRGWLGPYLLDLLVTAAAAHGVPNLQADVLTTNARMLSLIRSRGYALMGQEDWSTVRVLLGTTSRTPGWPGPHTRKRVLIEAPAGRWSGDEALRAAHFQVVGCPGPMPGPRPRCPLMAGHPCPLGSGADLIVMALPANAPLTAAVVAGHRQHHAGVPLCLAAGSVGDAAPPPDTVLLPADTPPDQLVGIVRQLTDDAAP